jgi:hypothetical protein
VPVHRRRRCVVCDELFWPDVRVKDRQKACSRPRCQSVRHAQACAAWKERHPGYDEDRQEEHKAYRLDVARGVRRPKRTTKRWASRERDEMSTQVAECQALEPDLAAGGERDEILAQVLSLKALAADLVVRVSCSERDEFLGRRAPCSKSVAPGRRSERRDAGVALGAHHMLVNTHAEARRDGDATLREHRLC